MKKLFVLVLAVLLLAGCGSKPAVTGEKPLIIVTMDALYEITSAVAGDELEVVNLLSPGEEIHHFEPTPREVERLNTADLVIYNGLGLDDWASKMSENTGYPAAESATNLISGDPHVWLSPKGAAQMAEGICEELSKLYPEKKGLFEENCKAFNEKLDDLAAEYGAKFSQARLDTFITGHSAFSYFAAEFGLTQKSISNIHSSEPLAKQISQLADFCIENEVKTILTESMESASVSQTLANECGADTIIVYNMESATEDNMSFLDRMEHNMEAVLKALE